MREIRTSGSEVGKGDKRPSLPLSFVFDDLLDGKVREFTPRHKTLKLFVSRQLFSATDKVRQNIFL